MAFHQSMEEYAERCVPEIKDLIQKICVIPAPSHHEELRASFVKGWLQDQGISGSTDDALNVIWSWQDTGDNDLICFMAHMDVVFPDTTPLPFREEGNRYYCPGIGDDTARLAALLICSRYFIQNQIPSKYGFLFVANSCEEGLGNLKGSRQIVDTYGSRIRAFVTLDCDLDQILNRAVGSHRYEITVRTEGGHSYSNFGNRNAIVCLSGLIQALVQIPVPQKEGAKTTYNIGRISGGTSVNTIAQQASMLYEYRSNDLECLEIMRNHFQEVIRSFSEDLPDLEVRMVGERPCGGDVDEEKLRELVSLAADSVRRVQGVEPRIGCGSNDTNYPLSKGIPSICIGSCRGNGAHTREEYIESDSLHEGLRYVMDFMSRFFFTADQRAEGGSSDV